MKIEIANPQNIYARLISPTTNHMEGFFAEAQKQLIDGESWKTKQPNKQLIQTAFEGSSASLVYPLDSAYFHFNRIGDNYSGYVGVYIEKEPTQSLSLLKMEGLSEKLKKVLGNNWISKSKDGEGYILYDNEPIINISKGLFSYDISIGKSGTLPRTLDSLENFIQDMSNLEKVTNIFVNSAMDLYVNKGKIESNPIFKFYLSCD